MPPRTSGPTALNGLTKIEEVVVHAAARLLTALEYREENPGGDFDHYLDRIPLELQLVSEAFQHAETKPATRFRFQASPHPVLTIVGQLWRAAADEGRHPRLDDISLAEIRKACASMAKKHPGKPSVFFAEDLSRLAYALPRADHWWLSPPNVRKRSEDPPGKGKASKALMYIGRAPPRGTKRSAASVVQAEEQADQGNDEARKKKTKRQKAGKSVSRRSVHVVIQSPKIPTRKRRRIEDTESSASEKSDEEEREEETSAEQWVGKGEDRCERCRRLNIPVCEPQWHSKRSISCKACARRKTACKATNIWKQKVVLGDQELVLWNGPSCAGIEAASGQRQGTRLKTPDTAPPAVATDQPPTSNAEIITAVDPRIPLIDQRIKEEMSDLKASIEGHSASLATLERTQQELKNMLLMLCGHQAITVATGAASTSTSLAVSPVSLSGLRAIEGSVPTPAQSSTSTTSKSRGQTRPPAASGSKPHLSSKYKGRA